MTDARHLEELIKLRDAIESYLSVISMFPKWRQPMVCVFIRQWNVMLSATISDIQNRKRKK